MKTRKLTTAEVAAEVAIVKQASASICTMRRNAVEAARYSPEYALEMLANAKKVSFYRWRKGSAHSFARGDQFRRSERAIRSA